MKNKRDKVVHFVFLILLIVLLWITFKSCNENKNLIKDLTTVSSYKDTVMFYKSKNNELISYNKSLELDYKNLKHTNSELDKLIKDLKIKKPESVTEIKTVVEIKEVSVPFIVELPCDTFTRSFEHTEEWLSINGSLDNAGIYFDSIKLTNDLTIVTGEKNNGMFKRNELIVAVKSNNPYFQTQSLKNYNFKPETPFYDKLWFKALIFIGGLSTGVMISK
jgi:hypothetical protein